MANVLARVYKADGIELSIDDATLMTKLVDYSKVSDRNGNCLVPPTEVQKVLYTLEARKLNPFTGDVIVQPRRNKDGSYSLTLVTTKDFYVRRAASNPNYMGKESGIVVLSSDGRPIRREGCSVYKAIGETLIGGWCRVHVRGREVPEYAEVSLEEYNQKQALWNSKPATMICKVAVSQALRAAFPNEFNGTYESEEIGYEEPNEQADPIANADRFGSEPAYEEEF